MIYHWRAGMTPHTHDTVEEVRACEAEHAALLHRLNTYARQP